MILTKAYDYLKDQHSQQLIETLKKETQLEQDLWNKKFDKATDLEINCLISELLKGVKDHKKEDIEVEVYNQNFETIANLIDRRKLSNKAYHKKWKTFE